MQLTFSRQLLVDLISTTARNMAERPLKHEIEEIVETAIAQLYGWVLLGQEPTKHAIIDATIVAFTRWKDKSCLDTSRWPS
jgi:hypothetical protein